MTSKPEQTASVVTKVLFWTGNIVLVGILLLIVAAGVASDDVTRGAVFLVPVDSYLIPGYLCVAAGSVAWFFISRMKTARILSFAHAAIAFMTWLAFR